MKPKVEILAPAGSRESLEAAVCAGADAVYIGGSRFGARAYADNPGEEELLEAIDYVHLHGRSIYLTVNTLLKERELEELYDYLLPYYRSGLDAVIVQDVGVMRYVKEHFPDLAIHVSTQAAVTGVRGAEFFKDVGAERIVPARELSLEEVRLMKEKTGLEVECFVHGALCYCYSGQCLLSSLIGGRSGNRGQCAQPCRLPYSVGRGKPQTLMSLKDLCTIDLIPDLLEAGVDSFKIEGRMKQPEYVYTVTSLYRKYADLFLEKGRKGYKVSPEDRRKLESVYRRRGYTDGYYMRQNGKEMVSFQRPDDSSGNAGGASGGNGASPENWQPIKIKEKINGNLILSEEKHAKLCLECGQTMCTVTGAEVQKAQSAPLSEERAEKQMRKTGGTEFEFDKLKVSVEGSVFLPMQALNELRREGLAGLQEKLLERYRRETPGKADAHTPEKEDVQTMEDAVVKSADSIALEALVSTREQLAEVISLPEVQSVFLADGLEFDRKASAMAREAGKKCYLAMPYIFRQRAVSVYEPLYGKLCDFYDGVLIRNWESYGWLRERGYTGEIISDSSLYVFNSAGRRFAEEAGIARYTMPLELNYREQKEAGLHGILVAYGYQPVMVTANCIQNTAGRCGHAEGILYLTDRMKKKFAVKNYCKYCYNVMYNCAPVLLADQKREIGDVQPSSLRLDFTVEDKGMTGEILRLYRDVFLEGVEAAMPSMEYTRGHFKRGVK